MHFLGGTTLHSALDFKFGNEYLPLNSKKKQELQVAFRDLQMVIIDEISMVGANRLHDINRRLQDIKINNDPFGGLATLLVGDILQLPPVLASPIFARPTSIKRRLIFHDPNQNLWENHTVIELQTNFR